MARATVIELMEGNVWAADAQLANLDKETRRDGWDFVGEEPPTVDQFNDAQQLPELAIAYLYKRLKKVTAAGGQDITNQSDDDTILKAIKALFLSKTADLSVGNGLSKSGALGDNNLSISMAMPGTVGLNSKNETTATSHTHAFDTSLLLPTGTFIWYIGLSVPKGFLLLGGDWFAKAEFPELSKVLATIGYPWGVSETHFRLENFSDRFIRSIGQGRAIGSLQGDQIRAHAHAQGSESVKNTYGGGTYIGRRTYPNGEFDSYIGQSTGPVGGEETRPMNIALLPCVKY